MQHFKIDDPLMLQAHDRATKLSRWQRGKVALRHCWPLLRRHAWQVLAFCLAIATVLWLLRPGLPFWGQLAYSLPMGLISWLLIDVGRFFMDQDSPHQFPRGWRGIALVLCSLLLAYVVATSIGDAVNGLSTWQMITRAPAFFLYVFLFGYVIVNYWYKLKPYKSTS